MFCKFSHNTCTNRSIRKESILSIFRNRSKLQNLPDHYRNLITRSKICCSGTYPLYSPESPFQQNDAGIKAYKERQKRDEHERTKSSNTLFNDSSSSSSSLATILSHAGIPSSSSNPSKGSTPPSLNEALCPPLNMETTYTRPPSGDYFNTDEGGKGLIYARMGNPTRNTLEDVMSSLEVSKSSSSLSSSTTTSTTTKALPSSNLRHSSSHKVEEMMTATTCAFSSGMAAIASIVFALSKTSLHILLPDDLYHGLPTQMKSIFIDRGVTYSSIDMTNIQSIQDEVVKIKRSNKSMDGNILIWMESPSNPLCKVTDIEEICNWVKHFRTSKQNIDKTKSDGDVYTAVDSTWAPPYITQPVRAHVFKKQRIANHC